MKAKCTQSIELPLQEGGFRKYEAGTIYDVSGLDEATIKAHFEAPAIAPPKGLQTRIEQGEGQ